MKLTQYFPPSQWLKEYQPSWLRGDIVAGLTVGVMLIPQGMAYALLAGLPPIHGLYTATISLIVYALLGTSRQLAVGPVAMISILTAAGVGSMAPSGAEEFIALAILLAFMVGVIQFLFGVFRLGFIVNFLSHPVISGFTSAAALIIFFSQLKHLLGIQIPRGTHLIDTIQNTLSQTPQLLSTAIGIIGIALIALVKKFKPAIPGPLVIVAISIIVVWGFRLDQYNLKIVEEVPQGLPDFSLPKLELSVIKALFPTALAIAMVSFMQSIAAAKALELKHRNYKIIPNQELISIGLANAVGAFFQGFPVAGGFARSAVNEQAGAKTGLASLISAVLLIFTLLFLTPIFYYLPNTILAAIIIYAALNLINYKIAIELWHTHRTDFWLLLSTFFATLLLGIEQGIGIGVILSIVMVIYKSSRPHIAELGKVPNTKIYRNVDRFNQLEELDDVLIVRFDASLYFANQQYFRDQMEALIRKKGEKLETVILSMECISNIDSSGAATLEDWVMDLKQRGFAVFFTDVKGPIRDLFHRTGLTQRIGEEYFCLSIQNAVDYLSYPERLAEKRARLKTYALQRNQKSKN
ncbi:MAG: sulfate permease [Bacteroidota bacterium]